RGGAAGPRSAGGGYRGDRGLPDQRRRFLCRPGAHSGGRGGGVATGKLAGTVCLVTGAAQGIGRGIVTRMAREGARVAVNARVDDERLRAVVGEMHGFPAPADIASPAAVRAMVASIESALGPIEVLVCNAARMT